MKRLIVVVTMILGMGCASSRLEQRVAQLEQELAAAKRSQPAARAISANEAVAAGDLAAAAQPVVLVLFVDERPKHCNGALCWRIENGHDQPVLIQINGQQVQVVGPAGPFFPPGSTGYIRLTAPTNVTVTYTAYDTIAMEGADQEMPLPTALFRCRAGPFMVGTFADAYHGGKTTRLGATFCL